MDKKTLVIGASTNSNRYAYQAVKRLTENKIETNAIGNREGEIFGVNINIGKPELKGIHTVTLYIRPEIQQTLYDYILGLNPRRIIFNPGTENREFEELAEKNGIDTIEACTLVMLSIGAF